MNTSNLSREELDRIGKLHLEGLSVPKIGKAVERDPRTIRVALKRLGYKTRMGPNTGKRGRIPMAPRIPEPVAAISAPEATDPQVERATAARGRLWDVLMDGASPGQAVVQAFNALAESEGWAAAPPKPLPEPVDETEVLARFCGLFDSYPVSMQRAILERLAAFRAASPQQ